MKETYFVYILANNSKDIYVGITNKLKRRIWEQKYNVINVHTRKNGITKLVYYKDFKRAQSALKKKKQFSAADQKMLYKAIEKENKDWKDLAEKWFV